MLSRLVAVVSTLLLLLLASVEAQLVQQYCSSQNTGASQQGVFQTWQSNGACSTQCQGAYSFAIVQGSYCWCSNYVPGNQVDVSQCSDNCPGYPSERCGNVAAGLFGYIYLNKTPLGTLPGRQSTARTSASQSSPQPSTQPQTETVSLVIVQTVTQNQGATTVVSFVTPSPSSTTTSSTSTTDSPTTPDSSTSSSSTSTSSSTSVSLTAQIITLSGQVVTQTVTATPFTASGQDVGSLQPLQQNQGISGGAIAGIVIGVLAGIAILLLAAFLLWRRRRQNQQDSAAATAAAASTNTEKPPPKRNTSVLSRSGLLARGNDNAESNPFDEPANGTASQRHSMLFGAGAAAAEGVSPVSPLGTSYSGDSRRHSKPMVYDQRLNPSALFANHDNGSRVSMQDGADYSRTLGVTNPDPRASWESHVSRS